MVFHLISFLFSLLVSYIKVKNSGKNSCLCTQLNISNRHDVFGWWIVRLYAWANRFWIFWMYCICLYFTTPLNSTTVHYYLSTNNLGFVIVAHPQIMPHCKFNRNKWWKVIAFKAFATIYCHDYCRSIKFLITCLYQASM